MLADYLGMGDPFCFPGAMSLSSINFLMHSLPLDVHLMDFTSCPEFLQAWEQTPRGTRICLCSGPRAFGEKQQNKYPKIMYANIFSKAHNDNFYSWICCIDCS